MVCAHTHIARARHEDLAIQVGLLIQQGKSDEEIVQTVGYQFSTQPIDLYDLIRNVRKILLDIGVQKKERRKAYSQMVTTMQDLTKACVNLFGIGWTYDPDSKACVKPKEKPHNLQNGQELAQQIGPLLWLGDYDILEKIVNRTRTDLTDNQILWLIRKTRKEFGVETDLTDKDYHADRKGTRSLRGTIHHREPQTVMGTSVVQKTTQKGVSVTKEKKKKVIKMKV